MGIDCMGMGGNGNVKSHSRTSLANITVAAELLVVSSRRQRDCEAARMKSSISVLFVRLMNIIVTSKLAHYEQERFHIQPLPTYLIA